MPEAPSERAAARRYLVAGAVAALVLIGGALRVYHLERESAYFDEVVSVRHLDAPDLRTFLAAFRQEDPTMVPLYFALQYLWARVTGGSLYAVRLLSILFWAMALPIIYLLGKALYDRTAGLIAAACSVLSISHIYYAQEVRMYSLVFFLCLASAFALVRALETERSQWWFLNVAANTLAVWTHLFAVWFIVAQGCFLAYYCLRRRRFKRLLGWAAGHVPGALLLIPWLLSFDVQGIEAAVSWRHAIEHSYLTVLGTILLFTGVSNLTLKDFALFGDRTIGAVFWRVFLLLALWNVFVTCMRWIQERRDGTQSGGWSRLDTLVFLMTWLIIPPAALFTVSALFFPCFAARYVLYSSVPLLLLAGGAVSLTKYPGTKVALACGLLALCSYNLYRQPGPWRLDTQSAGRFIAAHGTAREEVLVVTGTHRDTVLYNTDLPEERIRGMRSLNEAAEHVIVDTDPGWVLVIVMPDDTHDFGAFEEALAGRGLRYAMDVFGNRQPEVRLYHIERD